MSSESNSGFIPIKDTSGKVTGLMDQRTADYFASTSPAPTQQSVDSLLSRVTRVRVVPGSFGRDAAEPITLLDTSDYAALALFRQCFAIVEEPESFGHCMCLGDPHLELYAGDEHVATFGYHHGFAFRWNAWKHDACFREPQRLLDWMSQHGVEGPRREVAEAIERQQKSERNQERWLAAMPECLRPFWNMMDDERNPELHRLLLEALTAEFPTAESQALSLFGWLGSGAGPWSGHPSYESIPEELLLNYPTPTLIQSLNTATQTTAQLLGAARYFAGWDFWKKKKKDLVLIPSNLKQAMLQVVEATGDKRNTEDAQKTFAEK